jgi:hypothetical protein
MQKLNRKVKISGLCLLFILLATTTTYGQVIKRIGEDTTMYNIDLPGSDIYHFTLDAPAEGLLDLRQDKCAQACGQNDDCVAWTYVKPDTIQGPKGNCWLKDEVPAATSNKACVSGTIGEANIDRPGGDYTHFTNLLDVDGYYIDREVTARLCRKICYEQDRCKAWTFVKPNTIQGPDGVCWLKDSIPQPVESDCCTSGYFKIEYLK